MKHPLATALITLHLLSPIPSTADSLLIESGRADYNGNKINLKENVTIDHPFGKIHAQEIEITPERINNQMRILQITLNEKIEINLTDGGKLTCGAATIDYDQLKADFSEGHSLQEVVYSETKRNGKNLPLTVTSKEMSMQLTPSNNNTTTEHNISTITANNHVIISYNNEYTATGSSALYRRIETPTSPTRSLQGIVTLSDDEGQCQVSNKQGDQIDAEKITIDTNKQQLILTAPRGTISVSNQKLAQKIDFSSDLLTWNEATQQLTLKGHVNINQPGIGSLTTEKELLISQNKTSKEIETIESEGETHLSYIDKEQEIEHLLVCYGKALVDHVHHKTTLESPLEQNGTITQGKQVLFQDTLGKIFANKLTILYNTIDHQLKPSQIILEGNVRIVKNSEIGLPNSDFSQYALADKVEYTPQTKELTLSATSPHRVLYFDKVNQLKVSAAALKIRQDTQTLKEHISGIGDVRFNFMQQEFEQLQKIFPNLVGAEK